MYRLASVLWPCHAEIGYTPIVPNTALQLTRMSASQSNRYDTYTHVPFQVLLLHNDQTLYLSDTYRKPTSPGQRSVYAQWCHQQTRLPPYVSDPDASRDGAPEQRRDVHFDLLVHGGPTVGLRTRLE